MYEAIGALYDELIDSIIHEVTSLPDYWDVSDNAVKSEEALYKTLSDEQRTPYDKLNYADYELDSLEAKSDFTVGFRLGGALMLDILSE